MPDPFDQFDKRKADPFDAFDKRTTAADYSGFDYAARDPLNPEGIPREPADPSIESRLASDDPPPAPEFADDSREVRAWQARQMIRNEATRERDKPKTAADRARGTLATTLDFAQQPLAVAGIHPFRGEEFEKDTAITRKAASAVYGESATKIIEGAGKGAASLTTFAPAVRGLTLAGKAAGLGRVAAPAAFAVQGAGASAVRQLTGAAHEGESALIEGLKGLGFGVLAGFTGAALKAGLNHVPMLAKRELAKRIISEAGSFAGAARGVSAFSGDPMTWEDDAVNAFLGGLVGGAGRETGRGFAKPTEPARVEIRPTEATIQPAPRPVEAPSAPQEPVRSEVLPAKGAEVVPEAARAVEPAKEPTVEPPLVAEPAAPREAPKAPEVPQPREEVIPSGGAEGELTSVKNRVVNLERAERHVGPLEEAPPHGWKAAVDEAKSAVSRNPRLAEELIANPDSHSEVPRDTKTAVMFLRRVDLRKAREDARSAMDEASNRNDVDAMAEASARAIEVGSELLALEAATKSGGRETARELAIRRAMMAQDYSLAEMEMQFREQNQGRPLTPEQAATTQALHDRIAKALKERDAAIAAKVEIEARAGAERAIAASRAKPKGFGVSPESPKYGATNKVFTREGYEKTLAAVREKMSRMSAGIDPTLILDWAKIGAFHVEASTRTFAKWARLMVRDLGDKVKPHLRAVWTETQKQAKDVFLADTKSQMKAGLTGGALSDVAIQKFVPRLAEGFVRSGITDRNALIDAVHGALKEVDPSITRRQTMDAISGYGNVKPLNPDEVKAQLRELKGQMQQVAKLEDMAAGSAPLKTGWERQVPGDIQRELIREVNEAKKRGGYDVTDPAAQLKAALGAVKTRLKNQLADYQRQIDAGAQDIPQRTGLKYDAEAEALRVKRDELKKQYDAVFGKQGVTDEQRVKTATAAVERSIAEIERRIKEGDLFPAKEPSKTPVTTELEALRAQREALRGDLKELQLAARPRKTPEQIALQAVKTRLKNRIEELQERVATGNLEPTKRTPVVRDAEAIRMEAELATATKAWHEALFRHRLAQRTKIQKAAAIPVEAANLSRALMTSLDVSAVGRQGWLLGASHPVLAAKALPGMFKAFRSAEYQARSEAEIKMRPNYYTARRAGLFLAEHGDVSLSHMEEAFASRLAGKVPLVAGSQRAYTTYLNRLRMDVFDAMYGNLPAGEGTPKDAAAIANYVNVASGRGAVGHGNLANAMTGLNSVFFAPRLVVSRFQILGGQPFYSGTAASRRLIAMEYARFLAGTAAVLSLGVAAGAKIGTDPDDSDFGKLRVGDTRIDPWAGLAQVTVLVSRISGEAIHAIKGEKRERDALQDVGRFLRYKFAPVTSATWNLLTGKDAVGRKATFGSEAASLVTPMSFRDIYEAMKEHGVPAGAALGVLSLFGVGLSTYEKKKGRRSVK